MTIYTFGDPELLREALLALAAVFSLVEWSDPGSAMGLGGNMLAVALIGLLAVAIAGVMKQEVRVDYLLVALILFGVTFSAKVDVNVEDIQTGDARVVADIPIGIAMVAAASSSAAASLTEVTSLALQRPGSTTSILTDSGFLDPLKHLYALRSLTFDSLDQYANKSLLEFYKMCIGNTLATDPTVFDINVFRNTEDPLDYMLNPARFINFSTVYYSEVDPAGTAMSCRDAALNIAARVDAITVAGSDEALARIRLERGAKLYNTPFEFADVDDATTVVFRGLFDGQAFMRAAAMRNFINVAEAWRLAGYGTNEAQYVATMTNAYEDKRVADAAAGTIALQYMFPLMTFFQFMFFTLAPFVALIVIASPFTSSKTLGMYMLFGVWAYSWMPIAAVINHYIQINIGNTLEFADIAAVGVQYTALNGMDSLYDQLANKLSIGSLALASTPVIVAALLTASMSGIQSMAGRMSSAGNVNTSLSSPKLGEGRALVEGGGIASFKQGIQPQSGNQIVAGSGMQRQYYGDLGASSAASSGVAAQQRVANQAGIELETSRNELLRNFDKASESGGIMNRSQNQLSSQSVKSLAQALKKAGTESQLEGFSSTQLDQVYAGLGIQTPIGGFGQNSSDGKQSQAAFQKVMQAVKEDSAGIKADYAMAMVDSFQGQRSKLGELGHSFDRVQKAEVEYEQAQKAVREASAQEQYVNSVMQQYSSSGVDIAQAAFAFDSSPETIVSDIYSTATGILGSDGFEKKLAEAENIFMRDGKGGVIGADGLPDNNADNIDKVLSFATALANDGTNPKSLVALSAVLQRLSMRAGTSPAMGYGKLGGAQSRVAGADAIFSNVEGRTGAMPAPGESTFGQKLDMPTLLTEGGELSGAEVSARAGSNIAAGNQAPPISQAAIDRQEAARQRNAAEVLGSGAGSVEGAGSVADNYARMSTFNAATRNAILEANKSLTRQGVDLWQGGSGFDKSLKNTVPAAIKENDPGKKQQLINESLGSLNADLMTKGIDFRAMERFGYFKSEGFEDNEALLATYASVGAGKPGFGDYVQAAIGAQVGWKAGGAGQAYRNTQSGVSKKAGARALGWAKFGGAATGLALGLGAAYGVNRAAGKDREEGLQIMKDLYKSEYRMMNPVQADAFDTLVEGQQDLAGVLDVVMQWRETPLLTDEMLNSVAGTDWYVRPRDRG